MARPLASAGAALLGMALTGGAPAYAGLTGVAPPLTQVDLTHAVDGHRLSSNVVRDDGALIVSEPGQPLGDGYLHLVPAGGQPTATGPGNRLGDPLEVGGMAMRRGVLYALSTISDADPARANRCPLYRLDPATGRSLGIVTYWGHCQSPMSIDPLNGDLVLQDDNNNNGSAIVDFNPDNGATTLLVPNPPSVFVESAAFDPSGQTLFIGNSKDNPSSLHVVNADGIYAFSRTGQQRYFVGLTAGTGSPDAIVFGRAGTCFAGMLIFATDPAAASRGAPPPNAGIYAISNPSAAARPQALAEAANPDQVQLWMSSNAVGNPVISHDTEVTALGCPVPPPPPVQAVASAAPAPAQKPQTVQKPASNGGGTVDTATRAGGLGVPGPPPAGAVQTAPVTVSQPAAQAQTVFNAAPNAGLMDAPEDEHSLSLSASGLPLPLPPWMVLGLGSAAVTLMAATTYVVSMRPEPRGSPRTGPL